MLKRIISVILAALIIIALVGCGSKGREVVELTLSTEDAETILAAAGIYLPDAEEAAGANTVIQLYGCRNDLQNYSDEEMVQTGCRTFKNRCGSDIDYVECVFADRWTTLANLMLSDNTPDFYAAWATDFPCCCLQGMFQPIDDYMSCNDPLWADMKYMADNYFSIAGKHYIFITDVIANCVVVYNRRIMDEYGFLDPAELFIITSGRGTR